MSHPSEIPRSSSVHLSDTTRLSLKNRAKSWYRSSVNAATNLVTRPSDCARSIVTRLSRVHRALHEQTSRRLTNAVSDVFMAKHLYDIDASGRRRYPSVASQTSVDSSRVDYNLAVRGLMYRTVLHAAQTAVNFGLLWGLSAVSKRAGLDLNPVLSALSHVMAGLGGLASRFSSRGNSVVATESLTP